MKINGEQLLIIQKLSEKYPDRNKFSPKELNGIAEELNIDKKHVKSLLAQIPRVERGIYDFSIVIKFEKKDDEMSKAMPKTDIIENDYQDIYVPKQDDFYIRWGHTKDIETIIKSNIFYPVFITGLSGNGKTTMVEQACAKLKKNYMRVQISPETDEDDLIGGFRLVNGETVFSDGPVIRAMKAGALLLLDEIDRCSNRIMCLQSVLEGKPVLIKKTGELVYPSKGFNVIATANTKGKGSEDGRFITASILDEAFLERFNITMEQPYPSATIEKKIVLKHMQKYDCVDEDYADKLTTWSVAIRKTFLDGGVDEIISTRRLCHIIQTFSIFKDRLKSINLCVSRFDEDTKTAFIDLYTKIDAGTYVEAENNNQKEEDNQF